MISSVYLSVLGALFFAAGAAAQTAPQYGQCGGIGWTGATVCPSGWTCTVSNSYYSQCLPGAAPSTTIPVTTPAGGSPTSTSAVASGTTTLLPGNSFVRADEDPNFHKYLRSETIGSAGTAVLGDPDTAAQFQILDGQLVQMLPNGSSLYAIVAPQVNSTEVMLGVSWSTSPATSGTFMWSGDSLEWSSPTVSRPQLNAWLVCPDEDDNLDVFINLGPYDYDTPAGCADQTLNAYTGATATP
ncbi:carbohydrate-binding module family 1 protein, partial [Obba rivulosa]